MVFVDNNLLISFDYSHLNSQTLTGLWISNNNLEKTDIAVFSSLVNLKEFYCYSLKERKNVNELDFNWINFVGELNLSEFFNLKSLNVSGSPQLKVKLEDSPNNLSSFYCKGNKCEKELRKYGEPELYIDYIRLLKNWKIDHKIQKSKKEINSYFLVQSMTEEKLNQKLLKVSLLTNDQQIWSDYLRTNDIEEVSNRTNVIKTVIDDLKFSLTKEREIHLLQQKQKISSKSERKTLFI